MKSCSLVAQKCIWHDAIPRGSSHHVWTHHTSFLSILLFYCMGGTGPQSQGSLSILLLHLLPTLDFLDLLYFLVLSLKSPVTTGFAGNSPSDVPSQCKHQGRSSAVAGPAPASGHAPSRGSEPCCVDTLPPSGKSCSQPHRHGVLCDHARSSDLIFIRGFQGEASGGAIACAVSGHCSRRFSR